MARVNWKLHLKILGTLIFMVLAFSGVALGKKDNYTIQDTSTKDDKGFNDISAAHVVGSPFTIYIYSTNASGHDIDPSTNTTVTLTLSQNDVDVQSYTVPINNGIGSIDIMCPTAGEWTLTAIDNLGDKLKHRCQFSISNLPTIEITQDRTRINVGDTPQFRAWLIGDKRTDITDFAVWSSSVSEVATIGTGSTGGLAKGIAEGISNISATAYGVSSPLVALNVVQPTLTITPPNPTIFIEEPLPLHAIYFDAYTPYPKDVTASPLISVLWLSSDPLVARISSAGIVTGTRQGSALMTAIYQGVIAKTLVKVLAPTIEIIAEKTAINVGESTQFDAWLVYDDLHRELITSSAVWSSGSSAVATIGTAAGLVNGISAGTSTISATTHGVSATLALRVVQPSLMITPNQKTILIGETLQCSAVYVDAYMTINEASKFEWSSNNSFVNIGKATGLVTAGLSQGQSLVTAVFRGVSGTAIIIVNLPTITFMPGSVNISVGANHQLAPIFSEGYTPALSWLSSNDLLAPVGPSGIVSGLTSGIFTITAFDTNRPGVRGTVQIIVTAPVTPPSLPSGWGPNWKMEGPYD